MTAHTPILSSFNGGELSARMHGRTDQALYGISAAEMVNFVPTVEGPAMKRVGFRFVQSAMSSASWLSAFIFSVAQAYILEWGEAVLRFYTNGGRIDIAGNPLEVTVPYTAAQARFVSQQQSYDRLYLAHASHQQAALKRTGAASFAYEPIALKNGPFQDLNTDEAVTITTSGSPLLGGTLTVTASEAIFEDGHIGGSFLAEAKSFSDVKAWEANVKVNTLSLGDLRRHGGRVYEAEEKVTGAVRTGADPPVHSRGSEWDGSGQPAAGTTDDYAGVKWKYRFDRFGIGTITAVGGGGTTATLTVTRAFPTNLATVASRYWRLPAICPLMGFPKINLLAFGRMIYFTDFHIHASVVGDYAGGSVNMSPYAESGELAPDQAFTRRLAISNPVLWAKLDRGVILVGTADGTHAVKKLNPNDVFASDNIELERQNHTGSEPVDPVQTGISTIYIQRGARKARELNYNFDSDRYPAPNINVWQRHILKSGARQLAFQANPEELLWAVRNDGVLALHPHVPEQEVRGFARALHAGGEVQSALVVPGSAGATDELWVLVENEDGAKSIEVQADPWEDGESAIEDAFFVDSGVTYDGAPTTVLNTGLDHLVGKTVSILADGAVVAPQVVQASNPKLTLPRAASKVHAGLGYSARLTWLRPEVQTRDGGTVQGKRKRLVGIALRLLETIGVKFDPGTGTEDQLIDRAGSAEMDAAPALFTGDTVRRAAGGNWDRDGQGTIIHDDPTPCIVVAAMPKLELSE